jgi:hypothetical protein
MHVPRKAALLAVLVSVALPGTALAAGPYALGSAITASPATSPFDPCALDAESQNGVNYPDTEVEPFVAVNPTNTDNVIGVMQEDRWSDGGAHGLVAAVSLDGAATYTNDWATFSGCSGGSNYPRATDPWVSFDAGGRAYQIGLGLVDGESPGSDIETSYSTDGGLNWSSPVQLINETNGLEFNDKQSITGDRNQAGVAYATWIKGQLPGADHIGGGGLAHSFAYGGVPMFSKTTDGGVTWSTPTSITNSVIYAQGNQIVVLPNGNLVDVAAVLFRGSGVQPTSQAYFWTAFTSKNGGKTWSGPIRVAPLGTRSLDAEGSDIRAGDYIPDVAVDPVSGAIYMVFADGISSGKNHVKLTKSTDGGKSWSIPVDVTQTPSSAHSFNGTVEVTADGTVAVMYYDLRNNDENPGLPTDVWLTHSSDGGQTWSEQHVYGPFDMTDAPYARGYFLGDYQGLTAAGDDLILFFAVAPSGGGANVLSVRATP